VGLKHVGKMKRNRPFLPQQSHHCGIETFGHGYIGIMAMWQQSHHCGIETTKYT